MTSSYPATVAEFVGLDIRVKVCYSTSNGCTDFIWNDKSKRQHYPSENVLAVRLVSWTGLFFFLKAFLTLQSSLVAVELLR